MDWLVFNSNFKYGYILGIMPCMGGAMHQVDRFQPLVKGIFEVGFISVDPSMWRVVLKVV